MPAAQLDDALARLIESGLAFRRGTPPDAIYNFKHALVQDAAYDSLLKSRRQEVHAKIARVLEARFPDIKTTEPEVLARHFTSASLTEPAIEWWTRAGEYALGRSTYVEAIAHYEKAIDLSEKPGGGPQPLRHRLRLQIAYGQALISAHGYGAPETIAAFTRARTLAADLDDAGERCSVHYGLWGGGYVRGEFATMEEMAEIMLHEIENNPDLPESVVAYRVVGTT